MHPQHAATWMRELSFFKCSINLPGAGDSDWFDFQRGCKQGGVDTPKEFNMVLESAMEPSVLKWRLAGYGYKLQNGTLINHLIWADNILLIASSSTHMEIMIADLTSAFKGCGFHWKKDSLQF